MLKTVKNYADDLPGVVAYSGPSGLMPGPDPDARDVTVYVDRDNSGYQTLRWEKDEAPSVETSKTQATEVLGLFGYLAYPRNAQVYDWTKPADDYVRNEWTYDRPLIVDSRVMYRVSEVKAALGYDPEPTVAALIASGDLARPVKGEYNFSRNFQGKTEPFSVPSADYRVVRVA